jgi:hypothetical protein
MATIKTLQTLGEQLVVPFPETGEIILGAKGLEIAMVDVAQAEAPNFYQVIDQAGTVRRIHRETDGWWLSDLTEREITEQELEQEEEAIDGVADWELEVTFEFEMRSLELSVTAWHERLEKARAECDLAKSSAALFRAKIRRNVLVEIVHRVDPGYYQGKKYRGMHNLSGQR